ncbi:hypothetical protein [Aerococcus viridans]|uniref:hypothetical protein n=1 Tax=Aerococcus viridans TaxID=1377 RepID=UPI003B21D934
MTKNYEFFYDESEHSRKINQQTITAENYYDNFVTTTVGWRLLDNKEQERKYLAFETKYQNRKSNGELKSSTISNKQLKFGFASLTQDNIEFISDYLELFDNNTLFYISVTSKIEYIINQLFQGYQSSLFIDIESIKYSIVKIIVLYKPEQIINGMYQNTRELVDILKNFFLERIEFNKGNIELKRLENEIFGQIILLLNDLKKNFEIDWEYRIAFTGFNNYLKENSIVKCKLYTDQEGNERRTVIAAKETGIADVQEIDSLNSFGIRWADMLAGLLTKLLKALHNDLAYLSLDDGINKKKLSERWFKLTTKQLELYKKFAFIISKLNNTWYKIYAGIYSDDLLILLTFLNFISQFSTVIELEESNQELLLSEQFNSAMVIRMQDYFTELHSKLPIEPISVTEKEQDFFFGNRGEKIYFDDEMQPKLMIKEGSQIFEVLSVGISGTSNPNITILKNNEVVCYRIPKYLVNWAFSCIKLANANTNIFPSKVKFTKIGERYFADIL